MSIESGDNPFEYVGEERAVDYLRPQAYNSRTIDEQNFDRWMRSTKFMAVGAGIGLIAGFGLGLVITSHIDLLVAKGAISISMSILGSLAGMGVSAGIEEVTRTN